MAQDCSIATDALDHVEKLRKKTVRIYESMFGEQINRAAALNNSVNRVSKEIEIIEYQLTVNKKKSSGKIATKKGSELKTLRESKIKRLKVLTRELDQYSQKSKMLEKIREIMIDRVLTTMDENGYNINPSDMFGAMKSIITNRIGVFGTLEANYDMHQVASTLTFIENSFKAQDKNVKKLKTRSSFAEKWRKGAIGWWSDEIKDPVMAMLDYDKTGKGTAFVEMTKEYISKRYAQANKYKNLFNDIVSPLYDAIDRGAAYYRIKDTTASLIDQKKESRRNLEKIASEILDGETKFVKPATIYKIDGDQLSFSEEFKEDRVEYETKLRRNLTNRIRKLRDGEVIESGKQYSVVGLYEGGDIQKYTDEMGNDFFYIPIMRIVDGREIWNAYEVPTRSVESGGKTVKQMLFPNDILNNPEFRSFFIGAESSGRSIASMDGKDDRMPTGWLRSQAWVPLKGQYKKRGKVEKFQTSAYSEYIVDDQIENGENQLPPEIWEAISGIRLWSKNIWTESALKTQGFHERLNRLATESRLKTKDNNITDVLSEILGMDIFNNVWEVNGNTVSVNTYMGHRDLHMPWSFSETATFNNNGETRNALRAKIAKVEGALESMMSKNADSEAITPIRIALTELKALEQHITDMIDVLKGKDMRDRPPISQEATLQIAMHRSASSQPFENEDIGYTGRRKDFGVFTDYSDRLTKTLAQNDLKVDLASALDGVSAPVRKFIIDQTLATFNSSDAEAKLFGFDFGTANVKRLLQDYTDGKISGETLMHTLSLWNQIVSGNLLGLGSAMNNNWQRLSIWIENNEALYLDAENLSEEMKEQIVNESGVDDVMQSIGEALMAASGIEPDIFTGLHTRKDLALLLLEKPLFLKKFKKTATFKAWIEGMAARGNFDTSDGATSLFLETQWDIAHGLAEGTFTEKESKGIRDKLKRSNMSGIANKFLHFGLSGGIFYGIFKKSDALAKAFSFMSVEREMRKETAVVGALMAVSNLKSEEAWIIWENESGKSRYSHPEVLAFARQVVNATMFGMSPQFQNKAFRGEIGKTVFKFKSYQAQQLRAELRVYQSWKDGLKKLSYKEAAASRARVFKFWDKESMSKLERRASKLFMSRMLITTLEAFGKFNMPVVSGLYKIWKGSSSKFLGQNAGSLKRGGDSMLASFWVSIFQVMVGILNQGGDDEDEIYDDAIRYFFPIYLNSAIDVVMAGYRGNFAPEELWRASQKSTGIYSRGLEVGLDLTGDLLFSDD